MSGLCLRLAEQPRVAEEPEKQPSPPNPQRSYGFQIVLKTSDVLTVSQWPPINLEGLVWETLVEPESREEGYA